MEQMPDIVSSTTPEPTKVEENVVQQDVAQKTIKTENADAAAESGDNDSAESDIDKEVPCLGKGWKLAYPFDGLGTMLADL